jgi:hypothetical protein
MKYTYLFHRESDGLTKIGRTQEPQARFQNLGGKKNLKVVALIPRDIEKELHYFHRRERIEGEWFRLPSETLDNYRKQHGVQDLPAGDFEKKALKIKDSTHQAAKIWAAQQGLSLSEAVELLIKQALKGGQK